MGRRFGPSAFGSLLLAVAVLSSGMLGGKALFEGASAGKSTSPSAAPVSATTAGENAVDLPPSMVDLAPPPSVEAADPIPTISQSQAAADPIVFEPLADETATSAPTKIPATANPTKASTSRGAAAATPTPTSIPNIVPKTKQHIGLQAGHWRAAEQADELKSLRTSTGAEGAGWAEWQVNLDVANRAASLLRDAGYTVDLLPSTVPEQYTADVFLSLHGDANRNTKLSGFKVARAVRSAIPSIDDVLVAAIYRKYGEITGMPREDRTITDNMRYYYAFAGSKFKHTVAPNTPSAILELGFLTTPSDRQLLLQQPGLIAQAVATSLTEFLSQQVTPTASLDQSAPHQTKGDVVGKASEH